MDPAPAPADLGTAVGSPGVPRWRGDVGPGRNSPLLSTWQKEAESRTRGYPEVKSPHPQISTPVGASRGGAPPPQNPTSPRPSFGAGGGVIPPPPTQILSHRLYSFLVPTTSSPPAAWVLGSSGPGETR